MRETRHDSTGSVEDVDKCWILALIILLEKEGARHLFTTFNETIIFVMFQYDKFGAHQLVRGSRQGSIPDVDPRR